MADVQQAIRRLSIEAVEKGLDEVTAKLNALGKAQGDIAVASDKSEKAAQSLENRFASLERRFITTIRQQQDYEKIQRQVNMAVAQNPQLQDRANAILSAAAVRYDQAGIAARAMAAATQGVNLQLVALAGGAGPVGTFLAALGPWGLAAAVGIGAASKAVTIMSDAAHDLANRARELKDFSDVTGLTVIQVQALREEATKFGVSGDAAQQAIQQFTARFDQLRNGEGELLTQIRRVNPALADQMAHATSAGEALSMLGKALEGVDNIFQRNALVKAATGRGGLATSQFLTGLNVASVTQNYRGGLTQPMVDDLAKLQVEIEKTTAKAKENFESIFSSDVLRAEKNFADGLLGISEWAKGFTVSDDLKMLLRIGAPAIGFLMAGPAGMFAGAALAVAAGSGVKGGAGGAAAPTGPSFNDRFSPATENPLRPLPNADALARYAVATLQKQIAAMGDAATAAQRLELAQKQLAIAGKDAGLSQDQLTRAASLLSAAFNNQNIQAAVAALGSAATVTEQYAARVSALSLELARGTISQQTYDRAVAGLQRDQQIQQMRDTISALGDAATETDAYRLRVEELKQMLDQGRISQETFTRAVQAADPVWRDLNSATSSFGQSLVSNLAQGKSLFEGLTASASQFTSKMASANLDRFLKGGSLFGNQSLGSLQGGLGVAAAGLSGYQSGSPFGGALGGALAGASFGPVGAVLGGIAGALGGIFGQANKAKEEQERIRQANIEAWEAMRKQFDAFLVALEGKPVGDLVKQLTDARDKLDEFSTAAYKAGDNDALAKMAAAWNTFEVRKIQEFNASFSGTIDAFNSGLGADSPLVRAQQNVKDLSESLQGFVTDTERAFGSLYGTSETAGLPQVVAARQAAQNALLTLLNKPDDLSDVAKAMLEIDGTARQLYDGLTALGMSAEDAARAIHDGVTAALIKLRATFENDLSRGINDATGKGYLNSLADLAADVAGKRADALKLGADPALIDRYFTVKAQQIVDGAGLIGGAFDDLLTQFPDLTGKIHESTDALQEQIDAQKQFAATIKSFVDSLNLGGLSTLSPQGQFDAAQQQYQQQLTLAQGGDATAKAGITAAAQTFLEQARSYLGPSVSYGQISDVVVAQLKALAGLQMGGLVGRYAMGGLVGNGVWNEDSVLARYAGGGSIALAGGEYVNRAPSVNAATLPVLDFINRTGRPPSNDNNALLGAIRSLEQRLTAALGVIARIEADGNERTADVARAVAGLRTDTRQATGEQTIRKKTGTGG